jgi:C4-dicarboxylate transporter DctM subunit
VILVTLLFLALLVVGAPVAVAVGAAGFVGAVLASPAPLAITVQQMFHQVDSFVLLAFPLFVLAGALMETGGIARRLVAPQADPGASGGVVRASPPYSP